MDNYHIIGACILPDAYGAYPTQRGTPYWEHPEPRMSKDKIYSQSKETMLINKLKILSLK